MRVSIIAAFILLTSPAAMAGTDWVSAGKVKGPDGLITLWADMDSMHRTGAQQLEVWIKYTNARPNRDHIKETLAYEHLYCSARQHSTMVLMNYAADGRILNEQHWPLSPTPIVPDSLLDGMLPFLCAAGAMPQR